MSCRRLHPLAIVPAFFALALVGCKDQPGQYLKNPGPAKLAGGWALAKSDQDGVSIGVPSGWREGVGGFSDLLMGMPGGMGEPGGALPPLDPRMQEMAAGIAKSAAQDDAKVKEEFRKKGIVLHVVQVGRRIPGEEVTRFLVKKTHHPGNVTLEQASAAEAEFLTGEGKPKKVRLPVGPAMLYKAQFKNRIGDVVHRISYVMVHGRDAYALRFVVTNNAAAIEGVAPAVAETFRVR